MLTEEAVQLVLQTSAFGNGGEVYLLDMGEPVKILDIAKSMIRLSGLKEGKDINAITKVDLSKRFNIHKATIFDAFNDLKNMKE